MATHPISLTSFIPHPSFIASLTPVLALFLKHIKLILHLLFLGHKPLPDQQTESFSPIMQISLQLVILQRYISLSPCPNYIPFSCSSPIILYLTPHCPAYCFILFITL